MRRFLIDTDTASDDAVAILMALRTPGIHVEAITTVAGNVDVDQATKNALNTVELCEADVPVYKGLPKPMLREHRDAKGFHGPDGMGGVNLPDPRTQPQPGHAVDAIIETVRVHPGEITLVTLGPLSNVATALLKAPDIASLVKDCFVMGGAANVIGNVTPSAEYNIWCDPEAARIVFHSGLSILMVGWEHCMGSSLLNEEDMARMRALGTPYADFVLDINQYALDVARERLKLNGIALPDPVTIAIAIDRSVCTQSSRHYVDVEVISELTRGETVVDRFGVTGHAPNIEVCFAVDAARFKAILFEAVK